jgi:hypothetical protein
MNDVSTRTSAAYSSHRAPFRRSLRCSSVRATSALPPPTPSLCAAVSTYSRAAPGWRCSSLRLSVRRQRWAGRAAHCAQTRPTSARLIDVCHPQRNVLAELLQRALEYRKLAAHKCVVAHAVQGPLLCAPSAQRASGGAPRAAPLMRRTRGSPLVMWGVPLTSSWIFHLHSHLFQRTWSPQ